MIDLGFFDKVKKAFSKEVKEEILPIDGTVTIENNEIKVKNPMNNGKCAVLNIPEEFGLEIEINGEVCIGEKEVKEEDRILVNILENITKKPVVTFHSQLSEDAMQLFVEKEVIVGGIMGLQDFKDENKLKLRMVEKPLKPEKSEEGEILAFITEEYKGEIVKEHIEKIALSKETIKEVVMTGKKPIEGKPAYYEQTIEVNEINYVQSGQKVGRLIERVESVPGEDLYGNIVELPVEENLPELGEGIFLKEKELYSKRDGRLLFSEKEIEVIPQLIVPRDLKESDGYVFFEDGDVVIQGAMLEKSFIRCGGKVFVEKGIHGATILSNFGVFVKGNIDNSTVYSGWKQIGLHRLKEEAQGIISNLSTLESLIEELKIETKVELRQAIETKIKKAMKELQVKKDEKRLAFEKLLKEHSGRTVFELKEESELLSYQLIKDIDRKQALQIEPIIRQYKDRLKKYVENIEEKFIEDKIETKAEEVTNSEVICAGKVEIDGLGVYMSQIESFNKIAVKNLVKVSTLIAENEVDVGRYETYNTKDYMIYVKSTKGTIKITTRYPDTKIKVGDKEDINDDKISNVSFKGK